MAKYCGKVGYRSTVETESGIWESTIVEQKYYGEVIKNYMRNSYSDFTTTNHTIQSGNSISIVADPYARNHFHEIVYAELGNTKWTVSNVDASQYPRLILALGGVYNDESVDATPEIG